MRRRCLSQEVVCGVVEGADLQRHPQPPRASGIHHTVFPPDLVGVPEHGQWQVHEAGLGNVGATDLLANWGPCP